MLRNPGRPKSLYLSRFSRCVNRISVTGESAKDTVKTNARGLPGVSGVTVVTNARAFYPPRAATGPPGARHSLRPLFSGAKIHTARALSASRDGGLVSARLFEKQNLSRPKLSSPGLTGRSSIPETSLAGPRSRGVLDTPLSRGMTTSPWTARPDQIGFPVYGIEAVRPPSTGMAWPLT